MNDKTDLIERMADDSAHAAFTSAREVLVRAIEQLDRYTEQFKEADALERPERIAQKGMILNWTLSHLSTYIPAGLRLDIIANAQAEFSKTRESK